MALRRLVVFLAIIIGSTWSQQMSNEARKLRHQRNAACSIVHGNFDTQAKNNYVNDRDVSQTPRSQVGGGSALTQERIVSIANTGKLVVMRPAPIQLPTPLSTMDSNDLQTGDLLDITPEQRNGKVIYNLKQSLNTFQEICERMAQSADQQNKSPVDSEEESSSYYPRYYYEMSWQAALTFHRMKINRLERTLNRLIGKIQVGDGISDTEVSRARDDAIVVLNSHKKMALNFLELLGSS